jgi:L-fuculose-phosphate aldolase
MRFDLQHPRDQMVTIMQRIYGYEMTTTSGGNLSILDDNGDMWITPAGVDKGTLRSEDIVCVAAEGTVTGVHRPSSEYPFHRAIYKRRPDIRAVVHAHPPALVSFSIVRQIPNTRMLPQAHAVCGTVGYAPYALPGSEELGQAIARTFARGVDVVLLENHGVAAGGEDLLSAFHRFETLDFCARTIIQASILGPVQPLTDEQIVQFESCRAVLPEFDAVTHSSREREVRQEICRIVRRAYDQRLMTSTEGTASARTGENSFLITPFGVDRKYLEIEDLVLVQDGKRERGKAPSRATQLHLTIYRDHPEIGSIISAQSPSSTAYSVTRKKFDTRTIPESYLVLRDIPLVPYGQQLGDGQPISDVLSRHTPVILIQNDAVLTTGASLAQAFDRLEVAEFSARALIDTAALGPMVPIGDRELQELEARFLA